jgi:hypothetical protein
METAIVVAILVAALVFAGRSLLKTLAGRSTCSGACPGCAMKCSEVKKGQ